MPNTEANKSTVRDFVEKVFNDHNPELAREYLAPEAKWHGGILGTVEGRENITGLLRIFLARFPTCTHLSRTWRQKAIWSRCASSSRQPTKAISWESRPLAAACAGMPSTCIASRTERLSKSGRPTIWRRFSTRWVPTHHRG